MPRYEFSEGNSNKFWEITLKGTDVITHYGRIGAAGQETSKSFASTAEAKSAYDKLIAEKTKKGYVLKGGGDAPAAESTQPTAKLSPLVARLDRWMQKERPEFLAHLRPGVSEQELIVFETQMGRKLPQVLRDLLLWKNGEDGDGPSERFLDNYSPMSLKEIAGAWKGMGNTEPPSDFKGKVYWDKNWVPIVENGGGDYLCIDLDGRLGKRGAIIEFWHADDDRKIVYDSIDALLTSYVEALEAGRFSIEPDGYFGWWTEDEDNDDKDDDHDDDDDDSDEEEEGENLAGDEEPPNVVVPFMKKEFPEIFQAFKKRIGGEKPITVYYDKCGDRVGLLLARAVKQTRNTFFFWHDIHPELLKPIKRLIIRLGEEFTVTERGGAHQVIIPGDRDDEDMGDFENRVDTAICHFLKLTPLHAIRESAWKFVASMNCELRLNISVDVDWQSFVSNPDSNAIHAAVGSLETELNRSILYGLRSQALNEKPFRQQLRKAVRSLRVVCAQSAKERKLSADGPDILYRVCLSERGGSFGDEFGDKLSDVVLKMKPVSPPAKPKKDDYVQRKAPASAESFVREIEEASEELCKKLGSLVEFEIDWSAFNEEQFDDLLRHAVGPVCSALQALAESDAELKAKLLDRVRTIRLHPAATLEEKSLSVQDSTIVYRLLVGNEDGCYSVDILQEGFAEFLDSMPAGAPSSPRVAREFERLERDLTKIGSEVAKKLGRKIPLTLDRASVGNNLTFAREMDPAVIVEGLGEISDDEDLRRHLKQFSNEIEKITVRARPPSGDNTCERNESEWVIFLPAIAGNVSGFVDDQLREIEKVHYEQDRKAEQQKRTDDLGPQWKRSFKDLQTYVKQAFSMKMDGDVDALAAHVTSSHGTKAMQCFDQGTSNILNALLALRMEDEAFAKALEKSVKAIRFECTKGDEPKEVSFKNGVLLCRLRMESGASGAFTLDQYKGKLKKLLVS